MNEIQFLIITGMSGAGKTLALKIYEDQGAFCIDNLPPALLSKLYELCLQGAGGAQKIAVVTDIRGGEFFNALSEELKLMESKGYRYQILFLEASDDTLVRRYKETRRRHPLAPEGRVLDGIVAEREKLEELRGKANKIINTTDLSREQFKDILGEQFFSFNRLERITTTIISFGYKYGLPLDADIVMDVRFLPNPHYVHSLQPFTGSDPEVQEYIVKWPVAERFMDKFFNLILMLLPCYIIEGKTHLTIAIGCTGGRHRSVAVGDKLAEFLKDKDYRVKVEHRDKTKSVI